MGRVGLRDLAERNVELAHDCASRLAARGIRARFNAPFFNEFAATVRDPEAALKAAEQAGVLAGVALGSDYPELKDSILISVTEMNSSRDLDRLSAALAEAR